MKIFTGKVVSNKMAKTATVAVERMVVHPIYQKRSRVIRKYHVHDELGAEVGDTVKFVTCRPISKLKKWTITEIVDKKGKAKK